MGRYDEPSQDICHGNTGPMGIKLITIYHDRFVTGKVMKALCYKPTGK